MLMITMTCHRLIFLILILKLNKILSIEEQFGFTLELNEITGLMYVNNIIEDSQAYQMDLKIGDIISDVEDNDISLIGNVDKMYEYLKQEMIKLVQDSNHFIGIKFGRKKTTFPIVVVSRSGAKQLDGKYSIKGQMNKTYRFVHNEDPQYELARIYYDIDEDEAVYVIYTISTKQS